MSRIKLIINNLYPKDLYVSYSLLILRVIASVMMIINHGWNKILAGQEKWNRLGTALTDFIGIDFTSVFFGFMAAFSESIGMVMVIFGILLIQFHEFFNFSSMFDDLDGSDSFFGAVLTRSRCVVAIFRVEFS